MAEVEEVGKGAQVDPGDLEDFAKRMKQLADYWVESDRIARKLSDATEADGTMYPQLGRFRAANELRETYDERMSEVRTRFRQLEDGLRTLAKASRRLADQYRSVEELNRQDADVIDKLLTDGGQSSENGPGQDDGSDQGGN